MPPPDRKGKPSILAGRKVVHEGRTWCSIQAAARYLGTSTPKIRSRMGVDLDYTQLKLNGPLYVSVDDLVRIKYPEQE